MNYEQKQLQTLLTRFKLYDVIAVFAETKHCKHEQCNECYNLTNVCIMHVLPKASATCCGCNQTETG